MHHSIQISIERRSNVCYLGLTPEICKAGVSCLSPSNLITSIKQMTKRYIGIFVLVYAGLLFLGRGGFSGFEWKGGGIINDCIMVGGLAVGAFLIALLICLGAKIEPFK